MTRCSRSVWSQVSRKHIERKNLKSYEFKLPDIVSLSVICHVSICWETLNIFQLMKMVDSNKTVIANGDSNGALEGDMEDDEAEWNVMGPKNKSSVTRRAVCGQTPVSDIFRGQVRSRVQRAGDQSTDTVQPFFTLQLDVEVHGALIMAVRVAWSDY